MDKVTATARALDMLNRNGHLFEEERTFRIISETVAELIEKVGPAEALHLIKKKKPRLLAHIRMMVVNPKG